MYSGFDRPYFQRARIDSRAQVNSVLACVVLTNLLDYTAGCRGIFPRHLCWLYWLYILAKLAYILAIYTGYITGYIYWLHILAIYTGYIYWIYILAIHIGYTYWLYILAKLAIYTG